MAKKIITVLVILILIVGVGVGVYLVQKNLEIREKAAPATNLTLSADDTTPAVGQDFSVMVNIDTGTNQVIGAELYLNYDTTKLEAKSVTKGTFLPNPQAIGPTIDTSIGKISYTLYLFPGSTPASGQGTIAILSFNAKASGSTQITFSPDNKVAAVQEGGQNVLVGTTPLTLNVQAAQVQPTQTPQPTPTTDSGVGGGGDSTSPTPTVTTSASPTNTPTSTPIPSPTSSSSGAGGVQNTPTPTKTPTPTPTLYNPAVDSGDKELPDSGLSLPTMITLASGILLIIVAIIFAI